MKLILQAIKALFRKIEASRTHWEEVEEVEILAETTVTISEDNSDAALPDTTQLTVGKTYFVILNGVSYECVAWYSDDEDAVIIGNGDIFGGVGGNGEPFSCDSYSNGHIYLNTEKAGTYTISVSTEENVVHKLDKKYLPDEVIDSIDIANNAQITANNARAAANNAQTTANNARAAANDAQTTANNAKTTANNAKTTANSKMNASNPVGTGSFSMGRKSGTTIGGSSHAEGESTTASGVASHAEGQSTKASGGSSHAEGQSTTASNNYSHAEGYQTTASGISSHAEGESTKASAYYSHAEGYKTTASGSASHAEGESTTASGGSSHAEGESTKASRNCSHAEGYKTTASGYYSHAEGQRTTASGISSHAEGESTKASGSDQHVQGKYNVEDSQNKYAHIVGNGTDYNNYSNAHTLDWNGVPWFQGRPQFGGTAQDQDSQTVMANGDKEIILTSSTANSTKKFKITVDDAGTLTAIEVTA